MSIAVTSRQGLTNFSSARKLLILCHTRSRPTKMIHEEAASGPLAYSLSPQELFLSQSFSIQNLLASLIFLVLLSLCLPLLQDSSLLLVQKLHLPSQHALPSRKKLVEYQQLSAQPLLKGAFPHAFSPRFRPIFMFVLHGHLPALLQFKLFCGTPLSQTVRPMFVFVLHGHMLSLP